MGTIHPLLSDEVSQTYLDKGYWQDRPLSVFVERWAQDEPERPAIIDGDLRMNYRELDEHADRLAGTLKEAGVEPGDVVMAVLGLGAAAAVVTLANSRLAVAQAAMSTMLTPERCENRFHALKPVALIIDAAMLAKPEWASAFASMMTDDLLVLITVGEVDSTGLPDTHQRYEDAIIAGPKLGRHLSNGRTPSALITTGGTTGEPKTVMQFDNSLICHSFFAIKNAEITGDDVYVGVGPFGHIITVYAIYIPLLVGATLVPLNGWSRGKAFVDLVNEHGGTASMMTQTHAYDLWELATSTDAKMDTLRVIVASGKPDHFFEDLDLRYGMRMARVYGMSEINLTVMHPVWDHEDPGSDGKPAPGATVRLLDPETGGLNADPTTGEFAIQGPGVCHGYFGQPEMTASVCDDEGFFRSGDLVTLSPTGDFRVVGRSKEQIRRGGINIIPAELDALIMAHPEVAQACAVGAPETRLGEIVVACVVMRDGSSLDLEGLRKFLQERGVPYTELPDELVPFDDLPRNDLGRVNRNAAKQIVVAGR